MRRTVGLSRKTTIKAVSDKRRALRALERVVQRQVFERDRSCRLGFLGGCFGAPTYQHIKKASQGGRYTVENGALLCAYHNDAIESDVRIACAARVAGLVRLSWEESN